MPKFVDRWLQIKTQQRLGGRLVVEDAKPCTTTFSEDEVCRHLGHELRRNFTNPNEVASILAEMGVGGLAKYLRDFKLPTVKHVRHGDFGEILGGAIFRHAKHYCVPVLKLRYKHRRNKAMFGLDIVAFQLRTDPPTIAIAESKTHARMQRDLNLGKSAYEQLNDAISDGLEEAISFIHARFTELEGKSWLASRIISLLYGEKNVERHVVILHEEAAWSGEVIERLEAVVDQNVTVTVIQVGNLETLIANAYTLAGSDPDAS